MRKMRIKSVVRLLLVDSHICIQCSNKAHAYAHSYQLKQIYSEKSLYQYFTCMYQLSFECLLILKKCISDVNIVYPCMASK